MFQFASYLCFLTFGIGILFCCYLFLRFKEFKATRFLLALFIAISFTEFYMYALSSKVIMQMPFLFRSVFPFRILFGPLLFTYVGTMLYPEKKLGRKQWLHFIPAILVLLCLVPDFIAPNAYKLEVLGSFYGQNTVFIDKPTGIIPPGWLQPFTIAYGLGYCLAALWQIYQYKRTKAAELPANQTIIHWILLVSLAVTGFIFCQLLQYFSLSIGNKISAWAQIFQSISILSLKAYLLVSPDVIENMDGCINRSAALSQKPLLPQPQAHAKNLSFAKELEEYLHTTKPYLDPDFALADLAEQFGMPAKKISQELHKLYEIHFTEWVNRYRIHYLLQLIKEDRSKLLKLEALISLCGFQYRSSFYAAFKKIMNTTPSAYFKEQKLMAVTSGNWASDEFPQPKN